MCFSSSGGIRTLENSYVAPRRAYSLSLMNLAANIGREFFHHVENGIPAHHRTPRLQGVGKISVG
jgi:hypothetical protein